MLIKNDTRKNESAFYECTPEDVGIPSRALTALIAQSAEHNVQLHSLMVLRHGRCAARLWWKPYAPELPHHLYSASKSFTATAVGFAISEGMLSVDDRVTQFFPRHITENADPRVFSMTVEHLLTMTSGAMQANETNMQSHVDWVAWFLDSPLEAFPGDKYIYNSLNTYMLAAILRKVTGMGLVDYLMPRLFEPLGIPRPKWALCPMGIECGGWGLSLNTEALARFGQLYLDDGMWNGKRVLPEGWAHEAGMLRVTKSADDKMGGHPDRVAGYGYQFWRNRDGVSYRADGMMGQYVLIMPKEDMVVAVTAGCTEQMRVLDLLWDTLLAAVDTIPEHSVSGADYAALRRLADGLELYQPPKAERDETIRALERRVSGREYGFRVNSYSMLPILVRYLDNLSPLGLDTIAISFDGDKGRLSWREDGCDNCVEFGMDGGYTAGTVSYGGEDMPVSVSAGWLSSDTLEIDIRYVCTPHMIRARLRFDENNVRFSFDEDPSLEDSFTTALNMMRLFRPVAPRMAKVASHIVSELEGTATMTGGEE